MIKIAGFFRIRGDCFSDLDQLASSLIPGTKRPMIRGRMCSRAPPIAERLFGFDCVANTLRKKKAKLLPEIPVEAEIAFLTREGRGLTEVDGKRVLVHGALPGEHVRFRYTRIRKDQDEGTTVEVLRASPERVQPRCPHADICGGCSLQHMDPAAQIRWKQGLLEEIIGNLSRATQNAVALIETALESDSLLCDETCDCRKSLELAVWTSPGVIDPEIKSKFSILFE